MTSALIAYADGDSGAAVGICAAMNISEAAPLEDLRRTDGAPLILLWSRNAAQLGARYAEVALEKSGPVVICRLDDTPLDQEIIGLSIISFDGRLSGKDFARAALNAFAEARRLGPLGRRRAQPAAESHEFAGSVVRGFTSSVAVLGLGSVVAVGATERFETGAGETTSALDFMRTSAAEASALPGEQGGALLTDSDMRRLADEMRADEASERAEIEAQFRQIEQDIGAGNAETARMIARLNNLQEFAAPAPIAPLTPVRPAPPRVRPRAAPAPAASVTPPPAPSAPAAGEQISAAPMAVDPEGKHEPFGKVAFHAREGAFDDEKLHNAQLEGDGATG